MTKEARTDNEVKTIYSVSGVEKIGQMQAKKKKKERKEPDHQLHHKRDKLKLIKDLNVNLKTIKILEESIGSKILGISHSNIFFLIYHLRQGGKKEKRKDGTTSN